MNLLPDFPNLTTATFAYHVTNVPSNEPQPTWQFLKYTVASHTYFDGPLMFAAGVYFTTSFYERDEIGNGVLPGFSVYPQRERRDGIGYWRVKVPLNTFDGHHFSLCHQHDIQVFLLLSSDAALTTRFQRHPEINPIDPASNPYLCLRQNQWFTNVFREDGKIVNLFCPTERIWLGPGTQWDTVEHRGNPSTSKHQALDFGSAESNNNYWFDKNEL